MDYKTKLQAIITSSGLSQQALAEKIGTSFVSMNSWLNGKSTPTRKILREKIDALYVKYVNTQAPKLERRIKYYGLRDLATSFYMKQVMEILDGFDDNKPHDNINDILEIYNVLLYVENLALPGDLSKDKIDKYISLKPVLNKVIATFFNSINEQNASTVIKDVVFDYHNDLLNLLGRFKRYDEISSHVLLEVLANSNVRIWDLLENKAMVDKYDQDIRTIIMSDPQNAEHLIHKYLEKKERRDVNLPSSFTVNDAHNLIEQYLNTSDANPNFVQLITTARVTPITGIDAKLKLLAKRKHEEWTNSFFEEHKGGILFSCEVEISDKQEEAFEVFTEGTKTKFTYSKKWLKENSNNLSSLMNFIHLFPLVNGQMILTLPSYSAQLGVVERFMKITGTDEYPEGVSFQFIDQSTLMQTMMYEKFLKSENKELEKVIEWYFNEYLKDTFGADGFNYVASSKNSTYLEKCKHIFSEMDSVLKQFKLFTENGSIDQDLLSITSESPTYRDVPSQVIGKYVYVTDNQEISYILHYLFSDQSSLTYISETLQATSFVDLLNNNEVRYSDFQDHQKNMLDELIRLQILKKTSKRILFRNKLQIDVFKSLFKTEASSYYHYSKETRVEIDAMVSQGWLVRKGSLLTEPEAKYFNYYLNQKSSSNGHDLRNIYLHGSMSKVDKVDEGKHYHTYLVALRLFVALIIKIDDDFSTKLRR
jgi:transcriptional regulator with XRE-family HTH domain